MTELGKPDTDLDALRARVTEHLLREQAATPPEEEFFHVRTAMTVARQLLGYLDRWDRLSSPQHAQLLAAIDNFTGVAVAGGPVGSGRPAPVIELAEAEANDQAAAAPAQAAPAQAALDQTDDAPATTPLRLPSTEQVNQ